MKVKFYGCSDDLVEIEGIEMANGPDKGAFTAEHGCYLSADIGINAMFDIGSHLRVYAIYYGCWAFAVGAYPNDEDEQLPDWPIVIRQSKDCVYSAELEIECPEGLKCTIVNYYDED